MKLVGFLGQAGSGKDTAAQRLVDDHGFVKVAMADPMKRFAQNVFDFSDDQLWGDSEYRNLQDKRYGVYGANGMDQAWKDAEHNLQIYANSWLKELFGEEGVHIHRESLFKWFDWLGKEFPQLTPRIMLQTIGTEWGRIVDEDIWVKCMARTARILLHNESKTGYTQSGGLLHAAKTPSPSGVVVSDLRFNNEIAYMKEIGAFTARIHRDEADASEVGITGHQSEAEQKQMTDDMFSMIINNNRELDYLLHAVDVIPSLLKE